MSTWSVVAGGPRRTFNWIGVAAAQLLKTAFHIFRLDA